MPEESLTFDRPFAIVGDEDIVTGFKGLGFKVYEVGKPADIKTIFDSVIKDKISVCLVQEDIYNKIIEYRDDKHILLPIFVPFSKDSKQDTLNKLIRDIRLKATGAF